MADHDLPTTAADGQFISVGNGRESRRDCRHTAGIGITTSGQACQHLFVQAVGAVESQHCRHTETSQLRPHELGRQVLPLRHRQGYARQFLQPGG